MGTPYIGEIRMFGGSFAPAGWMFCEGQTLPISEHEALFNLIGTTYGGDGQETFVLPDLRGRIPIHAGTGSSGITYTLAEQGGVETVTLTSAQMPAHAHPVYASNAAADQRNPAGAQFALPEESHYATPGASPPNLDAGIVGVSGSNQPHDNMQPYLGVSFIISLFGIFPSPT